MALKDSLVSLAVQKVKNVASNIGRSLNDNQGWFQGGQFTPQKYLNPTSNNGNNFWGNQGGQNLANIQRAIPKPVQQFSQGFGNSTTYGLVQMKPTQMTPAYRVGQVAGFVNPLNPLNKGMGALNIGGKLVSKLAPQIAGKTAGKIIGGIGSELAQTAAYTGAQVASQKAGLQEKQPINFASNLAFGIGARGAFTQAPNVIRAMVNRRLPQIDPADRKVMEEFVNYARLGKKPSLKLEEYASTIAEQYNLPMPKTKAGLANVFDDYLSRFRQQQQEFESLGLPQMGIYAGPSAKGYKPNMEGQFTNLADKKVRFEIDDSKSYIKQFPKEEDFSGILKEKRLGDYLSHDDLYKNYPQLKDIPVVKMDRENGSTLASWDGHRIELGTLEDFIQRKSYNPYNLLTWDKNLKRYRVKTRNVDFGELSSIKQEYQQTLTHELQHAVQQIEGFSTGGNPEQAKAALKAAIERATDPKEKARLSSMLNLPDYQLYKRLSGELEARDSASRLNMSAEQRMTTQPYAGQGIPTNEVIGNYEGRGFLDIPKTAKGYLTGSNGIDDFKMTIESDYDMMKRIYTAAEKAGVDKNSDNFYDFQEQYLEKVYQQLAHEYEIPKEFTKYLQEFGDKEYYQFKDAVVRDLGKGNFEKGNKLLDKMLEKYDIYDIQTLQDIWQAKKKPLVDQLMENRLSPSKGVGGEGVMERLATRIRDDRLSNKKIKIAELAKEYGVEPYQVNNVLNADIEALPKIIHPSPYEYSLSSNVSKVSPSKGVGTKETLKVATKPLPQRSMAQAEAQAQQIEVQGQTGQGIQKGLSETTTPVSGGVNTPSKPSGSPPSITRPKYANSVNLDKLKLKAPEKKVMVAVSNVAKQELQRAKGKVLSNKEVVRAAQKSEVLQQVTTREQTLKAEAALLKARQNMVALDKELTVLASKGDSPALKQKMGELIDSLRVVNAEAADRGRQLQSLSIKAGDDSLRMEILKDIGKVEADTEKILREAVNVNWDNAKDVATFYRKFIKPSTMEILDEFRYNNMLSSPRTHIRNAFSNIVQTFVTRPLTIAAQGKFGDTGKYYKGAVASLPNAVDDFMNSLKGNVAIEQQDLKQIPTGKIPGFLTVPSRLLEAGDKFMTRLIMGGELARGATKEAAANIAEYSLFRQGLKPEGQGKLLNAIDSLTAWTYNAPKAVRWFVPFIRTPMNFAKQWVEYSPAGLATLPGSANKREQLAKVILGSTVATIGAKFALDENTTWAAPTDPKEKEIFYASGRKPFSVRIGDKWVSMMYAGPFAMALALPAAVKYYQEDSRTALTDDQLSKLGKITMSMAEFLSGQTFLEGMNNFVKFFSGDADYSMGKNLGYTAGQIIPMQGLVRWANSILDPVYRKASTFGDQLRSGIPGMSQGLEPYLTPEGQPSTREQINAVTPYDITPDKPSYEPMLEQRQQKLQQNAIINQAKKEAEKGISSTVGDTIIYTNENGNASTIDLAKYDEIAKMPTTNKYLEAVRESKQFSSAATILDNTALTKAQQQQALQRLGVDPVKAEYYKIANDNNNLKTLYVMDALKTSQDPIAKLMELREQINGQMIAANGVLDNLVDEGVISKAQATELKKYKNEGGQMIKLKSSSGRKAKKISIKAPKLKKIKVKAIKIKKIKTKAFKPVKLKVPKKLRVKKIAIRKA